MVWLCNVQSRVEQSELVQRVVSGEPSVSDSVYSVVYVTEDGVCEGGPADQGLLYCYPREDNVLSTARGAFITINHLLPQLINTNAVRYLHALELSSPKFQ